MKNAEQTNKVAGLGEKVLPGDAVSPSRENILPVRGGPGLAAVRVAAPETNGAPMPVAPSHPVRGPGPADAVAEAANVPEVRLRSLERTHDLMAQSALRLVETKADSLQVVIKPDAGTQLSLELRQRGGIIEAQACLRQGDAEHLRQHWPELQQKLEQRGIKLAPLASDDHLAAGNGGQGFDRRPGPPVELEPLPEGLLPVPALGGMMPAPPDEPAAFVGSSGGWQKWA